MSRLLRPSEYKFKDRELHDGRRAVVSITSTARSIPFARSAAKTSLAGSSAPSCRTRFSPRFFPGTRRKASLFYFLQDSQPWLQVDEQDGHEHVEQPQDAHLAAQVQVPLAQPQLESQEQAMMGCRKGSLVCWDGERGLNE